MNNTSNEKEKKINEYNQAIKYLNLLEKKIKDYGGEIPIIIDSVPEKDKKILERKLDI